MGKVFVAVPCGDGMMTAQLAMFLVGLSARREFHIGCFVGLRGIPLARNRCAKEFLKTECDRLWFLDADTLPPKNAGDVLSIDGDIVGGTYPILQVHESREWMKSQWCGGDDNLMPIEVDFCDVKDVGYVGFGNVVIRRELLEDKRLHLDGSTDEDPAIFTEIKTPQGQICSSDDTEFCLRAKKLGYTVKMACRVRSGHIKAVDLRLLPIDNGKSWIPTGVEA